MKRSALMALLAFAAASLSVAPARAGTECIVGGTVSGSNNSYQVRQVSLPSQRGLILGVTLQYLPISTIDRSNWHLFGGIWILNASTLNTVAYAFYERDSALGPPTVNVTINGQQYAKQQMTSTDLLLRPVAGAWLVPPLPAGSYYIVGFGTGTGTWSGDAAIGGATLSCPLVTKSAQTVDLDPSDFSGGTHLLASGVGYGQGITASFTTATAQRTLMALFSQEPEPLPPAQTTVTNEYGSATYHQTFAEINSTAHSWTFTANYGGYSSDAPLIRALKITL
jgi:hypothetical protein